MPKDYVPTSPLRRAFSCFCPELLESNTLAGYDQHVASFHVPNKKQLSLIKDGRQSVSQFSTPRSSPQGLTANRPYLRHQPILYRSIACRSRRGMCGLESGDISRIHLRPFLLPDHEIRVLHREGCHGRWRTEICTIALSSRSSSSANPFTMYSFSTFADQMRNCVAS